MEIYVAPATILPSFLPNIVISFYILFLFVCIQHQKRFIKHLTSHRIVLYCIILYSPVLQRIILYSIALRCVPLCCVVLRSVAIFYCLVLRSFAVLCSSLQYCIAYLCSLFPFYKTRNDTGILLILVSQHIQNWHHISNLYKGHRLDNERQE